MNINVCASDLKLMCSSLRTLIHKLVIKHPHRCDINLAFIVYSEYTISLALVKAPL